jgi:hypothetical protein
MVSRYRSSLRRPGLIYATISEIVCFDWLFFALDVVLCHGLDRKRPPRKTNHSFDLLKKLTNPYVSLRYRLRAYYIAMGRGVRQYAKAAGITAGGRDILTSSVLALSGLATLVVYEDGW